MKKKRRRLCFGERMRRTTSNFDIHCKFRERKSERARANGKLFRQCHGAVIQNVLLVSRAVFTYRKRYIHIFLWITVCRIAFIERNEKPKPKKIPIFRFHFWPHDVWHSVIGSFRSYLFYLLWRRQSKRYTKIDIYAKQTFGAWKWNTNWVNKIKSGKKI